MGEVSKRLGISAFSQEDFIRLLDDTLANRPASRVVIGNPSPEPPDDGGVEMYPKFVFDIPLSGVKHVVCGDGNARREYRLNPGEVLLSPPGVWKLPAWDLPHELMCLVFTKEFLRCTYVDCSTPTPEKRRPVCTHFYHTGAAPGPLLQSTLHTLALLGETSENPEAAAELTRALFRLTRDFLAQDRPAPAGKAEKTFRRIRQYLSENFTLPLSREDVAARFQLNPAYVSRLFQRQSGETFSETLRKMRLEHAAYLLRHTELLIDEITIQCGYQSAPFFTSAFHKQYGVSPGRFRK